MWLSSDRQYCHLRRIRYSSRIGFANRLNRVRPHCMRPREFAALLTAPLASGVLQGSIMGNLGAFVFGLVFAYAFAVLVGLPTLVVLRRRGWHTLAKYLMAGSGAGIACGLLLGCVWGYSNFGYGPILGAMALFTAHGFVVSLAYWLLAYAGSKTTVTPSP